ncbi:MAG: hypothetical protein ACERIH_05045 [Labilibaculum antarcticum]
MKTTIKTILLIFYLTALPAILFAQCNEYTKNECIPQLTPYTFNGQINNAVLSEGETAELQLTFYKDQEYRILVEGENNLGKIQFQLFDTDYNLLYDNSEEDHTNLWDFMVENTDDFIIRIVIPEDQQKNKVESGCVSILIGFRAFGSRTIFN